MSEWISVNDRLPEDISTCLALNYNHHVLGFYWKGKGWFETSIADKNKLTGVTHWMPLPELPKEEA